MPRLTHLPIKALDLDLIGGSQAVVEHLNVVPGFRTSAAFFSFLRQNLALPPSQFNSPYSTPYLYPVSPHTLPPLHSSSLATMTSVDSSLDPITDSNPLDEIPPLTTSVLTDTQAQIDALKLIADSIAQQRQQASQAVIFHPAFIAGYIAILGIVYQIFSQRDEPLLGLLLTTYSGITMILLVLVRGLTSGYITQAENFNWKFAQNEETGEDDVIIGSQFGDNIIGALILRIEPVVAKKKRAGGKGVVRAWTTKMKYRGTGVGTVLLEEAVKITKERLGNSATVGFAAEHAHSQMVLPEMFNRRFRRVEAKAARSLEGVVESTKKK